MRWPEGGAAVAYGRHAQRKGEQLAAAEKAAEETSATAQVTAAVY
jgi:hypothetical protein